ncbi:MAG TPA: hypothetical protein VMJ33_05335 [Gallionella sp.]|nr:hypothetical protein [Gallionella sp.]
MKTLKLFVTDPADGGTRTGMEKAKKKVLDFKQACKDDAKELRKSTKSG